MRIERPASRMFQGLILALIFLPVTLQAKSIDIDDVQFRNDDGVYYLDARIKYRLGQEMRDALHNGIVLTFVLDIELQQVRGFIWDEEVMHLEQRYSIAHQPLTRNYLVSNLNSGARHVLPTLDVALSVIGTIVRLPVIDANLLDDNRRYEGRLRSRLEVDDLPLPLRLQSYLFVAPDWRLSSEWFTWTLPL